MSLIVYPSVFSASSSASCLKSLLQFVRTACALDSKILAKLGELDGLQCKDRNAWHFFFAAFAAFAAFA
jgi:hypothetical protein